MFNLKGTLEGAKDKSRLKVFPVFSRLLLPALGPSGETWLRESVPQPCLASKRAFIALQGVAEGQTWGGPWASLAGGRGVSPGDAGQEPAESAQKAPPRPV